MTATRTEVDRRLHKVYLSALELQDVQQVLLARSRDTRIEASRRANCRAAYDRLEPLIADKSLIAEIEVELPHWILSGIGQACISDGLGAVGADILNQIAGTGESI